MCIKTDYIDEKGNQLTVIDILKKYNKFYEESDKNYTSADELNKDFFEKTNIPIEVEYAGNGRYISIGDEWGVEEDMEKLFITRIDNSQSDEQTYDGYKHLYSISYVKSYNKDPFDKPAGYNYYLSKSDYNYKPLEYRDYYSADGWTQVKFDYGVEPKNTSTFIKTYKNFPDKPIGATIEEGEKAPQIIKFEKFLLKIQI